jgi:hypothetical protein
MSAKDVKDKLAFLSGAIKAVSNDSNLSDAGKQRQVNSLRESIKAYYPDAYREVSQAWSSLHDQHKAVLTKRREAAQVEADKWSYERLNYYKARAGDKLRACFSMDEAAQLIKRVMESGSKEERRAYLESGSVISAKFSGLTGVGSMLGWMEREAAELTTPAVFAVLDAKEQEIAREVLELRDDTLEISSVYPVDAFNTANISALAGAAVVSAKVDGISGELNWCVLWRDGDA